MLCLLEYQACRRWTLPCAQSTATIRPSRMWAVAPDGTHDGGLEQGLAGDGGVAVQAGLLDHQSGGVTDVAQHLVGGGGDDQDHAGLELCADLLDGAADAGLAGGVGQISALGADATPVARQLPIMWILIMLVVPETPTGTPAVTTASSPSCR